jgi:hypothetical protein
VTVPFPLPFAPPLIEIQDALVLAVHAQPVVAVTVTVAPPPDAVAFAEGPEIVGTHGVPAWVTVKVRPPTVSVPVRGLVVGFAATL